MVIDFPILNPLKFVDKNEMFSLPFSAPDASLAMFAKPRGGRMVNYLQPWHNGANIVLQFTSDTELDIENSAVKFVELYDLGATPFVCAFELTNVTPSAWEAGTFCYQLIILTSELSTAKNVFIIELNANDFADTITLVSEPVQMLDNISDIDTITRLIEITYSNSFNDFGMIFSSEADIYAQSIFVFGSIKPSKIESESNIFDDDRGKVVITRSTPKMKFEVMTDAIPSHLAETIGMCSALDITSVNGVRCSFANAVEYGDYGQTNLVALKLACTENLFNYNRKRQ